jgi:GMP synthase (glutamine-hydrolysing)
MEKKELVAIFDFGSQYTQLIARRVRENNVYSEIFHHSIPAADLKKRNPIGVILSGGPASAYEHGAPKIDTEIFRMGVPVLGICYGMQIGVQALGGKVSAACEREYGRTTLEILDRADVMSGLSAETVVWMSHGDNVSGITGNFDVLARSSNAPYAAVRHKTLPFFGLQFHPEVTHTADGTVIINNFLYKICHASGDWKMADFVESAVEDIRKRVGEGRVVSGLSGGVDSSVVTMLVHRAIGERMTAIFVDNGLVRKGEADSVRETFQKDFGINFVFVDASKRFLDRLDGVTDPEEKRKIIGHEFIAVFKEAARKIKGASFLAQGTLYPDVIESTAAFGGPTAKIKSHHNVGGLPAELGFELVEPLRMLFKDEVRELGRALGLPESILKRQPFPGPGLGVRIVGEITTERLAVLREADWIVIEEMKKAGLYEKIWQSFAVFLPVKAVGVMGDQRTYENVIALRIVESSDGMTADWARLDYELLGRISNRIINEVKGVNRVVYDISSKPPATIEWE